MNELSFILLLVIIITNGLWWIFYPKSKNFTNSLPIEDKIAKHLKTIEITNTIHPLVKEIYLLFIDNKTVSLFKIGNYRLVIETKDIELWSANDWYSRNFTKVPLKWQQEHNMTLEEINLALSVADKRILDNIVQKIKVNNQEFLHRLFIYKSELPKN